MNTNYVPQHRCKMPLSSIVGLALSTTTDGLCPLLCSWLGATVELFNGEKEGSKLPALSWLY